MPQTHHSVAPEFVATYRTLGLNVLGYPVTEAFSEGGTLTQIFQRMELQRSGGSVQFGHLGRVIFDYLNDQDGFGPTYAQQPSRPGAAKPADIARFYQQHGGAAVFGAAIAGVFSGATGDGTGHQYSMELFDNARIERHPEHANTRFALQLGLIGNEAIVIWGWQQGDTPRTS